VCAAGCEQLGFTVTAKTADRLPNILHISKSGLNGKKLMFELSKEKIFISLGSACHANETTPSHVLVAMGMPADQIGGALRVSFSKWNTLAQVERFLSVLEKSVHGGA
jgi:cysteine desulfurase